MHLEAWFELNEKNLFNIRPVSRVKKRGERKAPLKRAGACTAGWEEGG
jgi:hypothetical protein